MRASRTMRGDSERVARGGIEAVYDDMHPVPGLGTFAPLVPARGPLFSSRLRLRREEAKLAAVIAEEALA